MKKQIRRNVFETNSSSVHSLTMCSNDDYTRWMNGEVLFCEDENKFVAREDIIKELKTLAWNDGSLKYPDTNWNDEATVAEILSLECMWTYEGFFDDNYYETFEDSYTTQNGENVVAFGYYGYN